jgi:hypothetical protein
MKRVLLLFLLVFKFSGLYSQVGKFIVLNNSIFEDKTLNKYIRDINIDSTGNVLLSFIKKGTNGWYKKEIIIKSDTLIYYDGYRMTSIRKVLSNSSISFDRFGKFYLFETENRNSCDEVQFVILKRHPNMIIITNFSCELHFFLLNHKKTTFNIIPKIWKYFSKVQFTLIN